MTDFTKYKFVADRKEGPWKKIRIWKYSEKSQLFYLVSPRYKGNENSVETVDFIETGLRLKNFEKYTACDSIYEKLNYMWNAFSETWQYEGDTYTANCDGDLRDAPWHHGAVSMKVGYHHGQLVWVSYFQYLPKVCYTLFKGFDTKPDWGHCGYTDIKNIKPVYSWKDQCYI